MITLGTHAGPRAAAMHHVTYPPANSAIQRLVKLGFLEGVTGRSYGRMYACPRLMRAVEQELPKSDDYSRR